MVEVLLIPLGKTILYAKVSAIPTISIHERIKYIVCYTLRPAKLNCLNFETFKISI